MRVTDREGNPWGWAIKQGDAVLARHQDKEKLEEAVAIFNDLKGAASEDV